MPVWPRRSDAPTHEGRGPLPNPQSNRDRPCLTEELITGQIESPAAIASREILSERSIRMTLSLAHLAPSIVRAIVEGRLPRGIGIRDLSDLAPSWAEQERALGL